MGRDLEKQGEPAQAGGRPVGSPCSEQLSGEEAKPPREMCMTLRQRGPQTLNMTWEQETPRESRMTDASGTEVHMESLPQHTLLGTK